LGSIQIPHAKQYRGAVFDSRKQAVAKWLFSVGNRQGCGRIAAVFELQKIKINQVLKCTVKINIPVRVRASETTAKQQISTSITHVPACLIQGD
jgi:hypothetical protein